MSVRFCLAILVGSWLLFLVEPMCAKMLLPVLGGGARSLFPLRRQQPGQLRRSAQLPAPRRAVAVAGRPALAVARRLLSAPGAHGALLSVGRGAPPAGRCACTGDGERCRAEL